MSRNKEAFKAEVKSQLDDLHRRIEELAELAGKPHEHAISYDTVVGEARRTHQATMLRLHALDEHDDWVRQGEQVRAAVRDLRQTIETGRVVKP